MNKVVGRGTISHVVILWPVVHVTVDSRVLPWIRRVGVVVDGNVDLHLAPAAGANIGSESRKTDVRVGNLIRDKL